MSNSSDCEVVRWIMRSKLIQGINGFIPIHSALE